MAPPQAYKVNKPDAPLSTLSHSTLLEETPPPCFEPSTPPVTACGSQCAARARRNTHQMAPTPTSTPRSAGRRREDVNPAAAANACNCSDGGWRAATTVDDRAKKGGSMVGMAGKALSTASTAALVMSSCSATMRSCNSTCASRHSAISRWSMLKLMKRQVQLHSMVRRMNARKLARSMHVSGLTAAYPPSSARSRRMSKAPSVRKQQADAQHATSKISGPMQKSSRSTKPARRPLVASTSMLSRKGSPCRMPRGKPAAPIAWVREVNSVA
mmetsp:Transcript_40494/g.81181  ORF Transcript_40494/g.81181 Transcript_40494/m.81181 type:complete len:271 (-) Transcript_40494:658-1470(-)